MPHSHSSLCLVLPWAMRIQGDSFSLGKKTCCKLFFAPPLLDGDSRSCVKPSPFYLHKRRYQRNVLSSSRDAQCSPLHFNSFPLALTVKTQILNMGCEAVCDLAPAFLSGSLYTTLMPITASNLTGFSSTSLKSQFPFYFRAFAHVSSAWNAFLEPFFS